MNLLDDGIGNTKELGQPSAAAKPLLDEAVQNSEEDSSRYPRHQDYPRKSKHNNSNEQSLHLAPLHDRVAQNSRDSFGVLTFKTPHRCLNVSHPPPSAL